MFVKRGNISIPGGGFDLKLAKRETVINPPNETLTQKTRSYSINKLKLQQTHLACDIDSDDSIQVLGNEEKPTNASILQGDIVFTHKSDMDGKFNFSDQENRANEVYISANFDNMLIEDLVENPESQENPKWNFPTNDSLLNTIEICGVKQQGKSIRVTKSFLEHSTATSTLITEEGSMAIINRAYYNGNGQDVAFGDSLEAYLPYWDQNGVFKQDKLLIWDVNKSRWVLNPTWDRMYKNGLPRSYRKDNRITLLYRKYIDEGAECKKRRMWLWDNVLGMYGEFEGKFRENLEDANDKKSLHFRNAKDFCKAYCRTAKNEDKIIQWFQENCRRELLPMVGVELRKFINRDFFYVLEKKMTGNFGDLFKGGMPEGRRNKIFQKCKKDAKYASRMKVFVNTNYT